MEDLADVPLFSDVRYADLSVGDSWGPFTDRLDQAVSDGLRGAVGAATPGTGAPLGVLPLLTLRALRLALRGIVAGGVLVRQHFSVLEALPADAATSTGVWVSAQQWRPSGCYTTFTFSVAHEGRPKALVEWVILAPPEQEPA
jgi:hypothetical protein